MSKTGTQHQAGDWVVVTGDTAYWHHDFEPGSPVEVVEPVSFSGVPGYAVRDRDGEEWHVAEVDLAEDTMTRNKWKIGAKLVVTGDKLNWDHQFEVGAVVEAETQHTSGWGVRCKPVSGTGYAWWVGNEDLEPYVDREAYYGRSRTDLYGELEARGLIEPELREGLQTAAWALLVGMLLADDEEQALKAALNER